MSAWVECFVSVRFDLDVGPKVEHVAPVDALTEDGQRLVAQAAFPDCNPDCGHEFIFFFTIRDTALRNDSAVASSTERGCAVSPPPLDSGGRPQPAVNNGSFPSGTMGLVSLGGRSALGSSFGGPIGGGSGGARVAPPVGGVEAQAPQLLLGVAHYRQKKDSSVPRGYVQQVFLLLSRLPYVAVHELVMRVVAPRCNQCCHLSPDTARTPVSAALGPVPACTFAFDGSFHPAHATQGEVLDLAFAEVAAWPSPHPHVQYAVTLLNQSLSFVTPPRQVRPSRHVQWTRSRKAHLDDRVRILDKRQPSCPTELYLPLYHILGDHLTDLTRLWELLISHEHLLVLSNTPSMSSAAAVAIVSLIMPIRFVGDLRTYFTVQDADFALLSRLGKKDCPFPQTHSVVVSGTNPFFVRSFSGWRHLLGVCDQFSNKAVHGRGLSSLVDGDSEGDAQGIGERAPSTASFTGDPSPKSPPSSATSARSNSAWSALQWGFQNVFCTNHTFVLNHKEQTELLQLRVSQGLKLSPEVQRLAAEEIALRDIPGANNPVQPVTLVDDLVRRFFQSLTTQFLAPVRAWFDEVVRRECEPFQLCCVNILDTPLFHPTKFLAFLKEHRKRVVAPLFQGATPYRTYKALYERFAQGVLLRSYVSQLLSAHVEAELEQFTGDAWAADIPCERRTDMFIGLHSYALCEFEAQDPDLVLLASATAVLTEMAMRAPAHLQAGLLEKVEMLKLP